MTDTTLADLQATMTALACLERSLFHLYREKDKYPPQMYAAMAEGTADDICKLRAEIDAAIGLTEFATSSEMYHPLPPKPELPPSRPHPAANGANGPAVAATETPSQV